MKKHHSDLWDTRIEWVFRSEASKSGGKTILGTAKKISGLAALLATPEATGDEDLDFFVITIAEDIWEYLSPKQRIALVDHELCHCKIEEVNDEGDLKLLTVAHDIEEFSEIVVRHGLWRPDLRQFFAKQGPEQLRMFADAFEGEDNVREMEPHSNDDPVARVGKALDGATIDMGDGNTATVSYQPGYARDSGEEPPDDIDAETGEMAEAAAGESDPEGPVESEAERIARERAEVMGDPEF